MIGTIFLGGRKGCGGVGLGSLSGISVPANQAPAITVPGSQSATSNVALAITGTSIADADGNSQTLTITTNQSGTISLASTSGLTGSGNGTNSLSYSGTLANINTAIATLTYTSATDYVGSETITIGSNDGAGGTDSKTIAITVQSPILGLFTYYWKLDEASGVAASSATAADLTATNSPVAGTGKVGNGRAFVAASSQQLSRNMILGINYNTDWTLCLWVNPVGVSGFQGIFKKNTPASSFRFFLSGSAYSQDWGGGPGYTSDASFFAAGTWCQVTVTYQGTGDKKIRTYKNGTLVNTSTANAGTQSDNDAEQELFIGSLGGSGYLGGIVDEVGFAASTCFDADQVMAYYDATNAGRGYPNF